MNRGSPELPRAATLRLVGAGTRDAVRRRLALPFGAVLAEDAAAVACVVDADSADDETTLARALPDPDRLAPGTVVVFMPDVVGAPTLASRVRAMFGRAPVLTRAARATALVARGYVDVAAGTDAKTDADLVWGYAPERALPEEA